MIPQTDKNDVLLNTPFNSDIEVAILSEKLQAHERRAVELSAEVKKLTAQIALLNSQNQTLHNCWQSAIQNHIQAQTEARAWISRAAFKDAELGELRRQITSLEAHLNPKEEAA
ncbi:MAG: hypothetical protein ACRCZS_06595 [Chroococcidiopsis sp.]